jgi:peroxiredoxin
MGIIQTGAAAPNFHLPDLEGQMHALEDWRGRIVIVNFWSAECPWAEEADRELLSHLPAWGDAVVLMPVASNQNETLSQLRQAAAQRGLPHLLLDQKGHAADSYGAQTTPHLFVIDPQGIVRYQGAFNDRTFRQRTPTRAYLREAVEALLDGRSPDPDTTQPYGCALVLPWL